MKSKKINIMYIIDSIGWAGAQTHLLSVLTNINYNNFNVSVVCLRSSGEQFHVLKELPIDTLVLNLENLMSPLKTLNAIFELNKFLKKSKTDILHSYMFNPNLIASIMAWIPWRRFKLITTRRDTGYWHQQHHWWLYRFMNIMTTKIIAVSSQVKKESVDKEGVSPEKIITIFNGIDLGVFNSDVINRDKVRSSFDIKENEFVIGILAAMRPEKRHDIFIDAARKVIEELDDVKFMIVGDGYKETRDNINGLIADYKLKDKFILTGALLDVVPALASFDVSVLCSDTEGMSNTVLQSIAMGKATIVTDVGGNPEVIEDRLNGILIPPNDPDALAKSIIDLYRDKTTKKELEQQAINIANQKFNIFPIIESLENVYTDIVSE